VSQELTHRRLVHEQPAGTNDTRDLLKRGFSIGDVIARAEVDDDIDAAIRQRQRVNVGVEELAVDRTGPQPPGKDGAFRYAPT